MIWFSIVMYLLIGGLFSGVVYTSKGKLRLDARDWGPIPFMFWPVCITYMIGKLIVRSWESEESED